jgi:branched-chain amino acid transport system permease protein
MVDTLLQGLLLGGLYALFALGQSLMFGVMRLTNTAQGDFIILGGFFAISLASTTGLAPGWALLLLAPGAFVFGYALQRFVLNGTLGKDRPAIIRCRRTCFR